MITTNGTYPWSFVIQTDTRCNLAMGHEYVQQRPLITNYYLLGDDASCIYK